MAGCAGQARSTQKQKVPTPGELQTGDNRGPGCPVEDWISLHCSVSVSPSGPSEEAGLREELSPKLPPAASAISSHVGSF